MFRVLGLLVCLVTPALAADPAVTVVDLLQLKTGDLQSWERLRRTSDSDPLTLEELEKLAAAGVGDGALLEMMRTRKVLALADADTLVRLKKAGASDDMIAALSAHAVAPNKHFDLWIQLQVASPGAIGRAPHLYIEVVHAGLKRQEALMHADLRKAMARQRPARDDSDPLLPRTVRGLDVRARVDATAAGPLTLRILTTQRADLRSLDPASLPPAEAKRMKTHTIAYPAVSLDNRCRLELDLERDAVMTDHFAIARDALDCRWK